MKLTRDQIHMLAKELTIDELGDNDGWKEMVKQIQAEAAGDVRILLHRHMSTLPFGSYELPTGATHYVLCRLVDGPAIDFWRIEP
jgi:hypothetical protein